MASIGAPHGVRGEVRLTVFAENLVMLTELGPYRTEDGREVSITAVRMQGERLIARLAGIGDREAAAALTGAVLHLEREQLPPIDEDETWYHADLLGLTVELPDGTAAGEVTAIHDFGAGDLLEVTAADGRQTLVPFTRQIVPEVDLEAGRLRVDPPEGLLD